MSQEQGGSPDFKKAKRQKQNLTDDKVDRLPPHSLEGEQGVLGCLLLSPSDCLPLCIEKFKDSAVFYDLRHRTIYEAMLSMYADGVPIDTILLGQELKDLLQLEGVGGLPYLSSLPDCAPSAANLDYYIEIVREKYTLRTAIATCIEVASRAYEHQGEVDELIEQLEHDILAITQTATQVSTMRKASQLSPITQQWIETSHQSGGQMTGIPTGFVDFDVMTNGLQPGEMTVIAARPSVGKSSLCMNIADYVAGNLNLPTCVFSLEMTGESLMHRTVCSRARVNMRNIRDGHLSQQDFTRLANSLAQVHHSPLYIDDAGGTSILQLQAKARRFHQQHGIRLFVIDYLQMLTATHKRMSNRQEEITAISGGVKLIAKELKVPIIIAAQLNRDIEKEKNRKPRLSDLRESGSIEQDADVVGMLYRPKVEDEDTPDDNSEAIRINLLIAKQRNGPVGTVPLTFLKSYTRFESTSSATDQEQSTTT